MNLPDVVPMRSYEDGVAALTWLSNAFGFSVRTRVLSDDNKLLHGELEAGDGLIMIAEPGNGYVCPLRLRETCEEAAAWSRAPIAFDGVLVFVNDIEAHRRRAEKAGAVMLSPIETDPPARRYRAEDIEGHRWIFMEKPATA